MKPSIDYLLEQSAPKDIVLWTNYADGGYAEFRGIAAYIDPRAEVFLPGNNGSKDILDEYIALETGRLHYKDFIGRYEFTHFLTAKNDILYTYLYADDAFTLIYEDEEHRLFVPSKNNP